MMPIQSLFTYVRRHRGCLLRIAGWSLGVTLAPALSGRLIANGIDAAREGDLTAALAWIGALPRAP